jgi:ribosomal protein S18 acetylase RimI-like enzyme
MPRVSPAASPRNPPYSLRPCRKADLAFVVALTETVMRAHAERTWGSFDKDFHRAAFHAAFGKLDHSIIVCDGVDAGYVAIAHRPDVEYLQWLLLAPAFQNRGIGTTIVRELIASARAAGKPAQLRILAVNTGARRLYERLGFAILGAEPDFIYMEHVGGAPSS